MNRRIATLILAVVLAAQVQAPAPALTCKIMRFGSGKPTCMCRGENARWRAWPMAACLVRR